jgi:hypothetical protein
MASCSCRSGSGSPCCDSQLPLDEIEPGDHLGDRMLDLQSGVHFHEEKLAVRGSDEFHRPRADVAHRFRGGDGGRADFPAALFAHSWGGGFLEHFLVAALHRAIPLEQVQHVAVRVAEHLHFDMPRPLEILLQQHTIVAEARLRLALCSFERRLEFRCATHDAHALAAAAGRCLDQNRKPDLARLAREVRRILAFAVIPGHHRNLRLRHQRLRARLVAHRRDRLRRRADEYDPRFRAGGGERLVLGEESVPGVNRLGAAALGHFDNRIAPQIAFARRGWADAKRFVREGDVARVRVRFRVDRGDRDSHAARGLRHPAGDLAAIRDQDLAEHARSSPRSRRACASRGTKRFLPCLRQ